jgi:hypothetical protein
MDEVHPYGLAVTICGQRVWEDYLGYTIKGNLPPPPPSEEVLKTLAQLEGKTETPRRILAFIPEKLAFNTLRTHMEKPKKGYATPIRLIWDRIVQELGDKADNKACWVLFSDVMNGSRTMSYADQEKLVERETKPEGETESLCEMPDFTETVACVALKNVKTGERMLNDDPWTYTRCKGKIVSAGGSEWRLAVGGFSRGGLDLDDYCNFDSVKFGVVACRKF